MEYKQSTSIMFSNFGLVFKLLLYFLVVSLIFVALSSAVIIPLFSQLKSNEDMQLLWDNTKGDTELFLKGGASIDETYYKLKDDFAAIVKNFFSSTGMVVFICIAIFVIYLIYKFLISLSYLVVSDILNNFMSSNLRYGFLSNYTLNLRRSARYALAKILVYIPIDIFILFAIGVALIGLWEIIKVFSLPFVFSIGLFLFAYRDSLFAGWLPRLIFNTNEKMFEAFKRGFKATKDYRKSLLAAILIQYFLYVCLMGAFTLPTLGVMAIIAQPINYVMLRIIELVCYYKNNRMKFYTDANTVVDTVAVGMREENQEKHSSK